MSSRLTAVLLTAALLAAIVPGVANAATITVNSTADNFNVAGECTLRDAIDSAADDTHFGNCLDGAGDDTIVFVLPAGSTILLREGALVLPPEVAGNDIDIEGPGADKLTISGGGATRIFQVENSPNGAEDAISGLTITHGKVESSNGGGGILNEGDLTLEGLVVTENEVKVTASANAISGGGGIANGTNGILALTGSTVSYNSVGAVAPTGIADVGGGGLYNQGTLRIARSTIAGNSAIALGATGQSSSGAGIVSGPSGSLAVFSSTVARNEVMDLGGGTPLLGGANVSATGTTGFESTIVAEPKGATNCSAAVTSHGFNLEDGDSCGFGEATDQPDTDPKLASAGLADNGGPTPTIALEPGSPALDQGLAAPGETTDQRGAKRPVALPGLTAPPGGDHADIGAYEQQAPETTEPTEPTNPGGGPTGGGPSGGGGGASAPSSAPSPAPSPVARLTVAISHVPAKTTKRRVRTHFRASLPDATFRCALDGGRPQPCHSPFKTKKLGLGKHTFTVVASAAGQHSKPAKALFRVVQPRKHR